MRKMKTIPMLVTALFFVLYNHSVNAQRLIIGSGVRVTLGKSSILNINEYDLSVNGHLHCDTNSMLIAGGVKEKMIEGYNLHFYSLKIDGNANLSSFNDSIVIEGDVLMNKGVLNLSNPTYMSNQSFVLSEGEESYITGSSIIKELEFVPHNYINTGLGLSLTSNSFKTIILTRRHDRLEQQKKQSAAKYYEFSSSLDILSCEYEYLDAYGKCKNDDYLMYASVSGEWQYVEAYQNKQSKKLFSKSAKDNVKKLTIFPLPELSYTNYVTPNGLTPYFEILGLERYPYSRLVVLNPQGKKVYEKAQYDNNFSGRIDNKLLAAGTYYFMFYLDKEDSNPVKKGFLEIIY